MGFEATLSLVVLWLFFCCFVCLFVSCWFVLWRVSKRDDPDPAKIEKGKQQKSFSVVWAPFGGEGFEETKGRRNKIVPQKNFIVVCFSFLFLSQFSFFLLSFFCLSFFSCFLLFCFKGEETEKMKRKQRQKKKNMAEDNARITIRKRRQEEQ